jgi:hypothetical protein
MTHLVPVLRPVLGSPFRRADLYRKAGEMPSFHIAPAALGHAHDLITGSVLGTYNSATPAMAVGADGLLFTPAANAPVIEYDLATLRPLGARIWDVVTQQARATRDLTQSTVWTASAITPTRDQVGTDGTANSATRLTATASDGTILQTFTSASATRVSGFWVRRITGTGTVEITMNGGSTWTALTLTTTFARYSIPAATITNPQIGFRIRSNGDEIAVDGVQLQSAATLGPTVFNPSTTLSASSTADVWSITGADATRIINPAEFTVYIDGYRLSTGVFSGFPNFYSISDGSNNNSVAGYGIDGGQSVTNSAVRSGGADQTDFVFVSLAGSQSIKIVQALAVNDSRFGVNGTLTTRDSSVTMPVGLNRIGIGSDRAGANQGNFYIREMMILRSRRPDSNLSAIMQ